MDEKQVNDIFSNTIQARGCCMAGEPGKENEPVFRHGCSKLDVHNWLKDIPLPPDFRKFDCIEVRFKNNRKDFYRLQPGVEVHDGDIVAVEASPGHDIGVVTLTGELVRMQMRRKNVNPAKEDLRKVYRRARQADIEKWMGAVNREDAAIFKCRKIAAGLGLKMKVNDVEYQGDDTKAIFYYTADDRVDFRELIKVLAEEFRIRIEMRQIGVRQEASRLGGLGTCGRELCCSTWLTGFHSVATSAARVQQLSHNPQKLAGQCGKLKCCLNYEYEAYIDALKDFPDTAVALKTKDGDANVMKIDVFGRIIWYAYKTNDSDLYALPVEQVKKIQQLNKQGKAIEKLEDYARKQEKKSELDLVVGQDDLTRFDKDRF
ncbi:MAG TPA: regulatory iron-sulfur-containing complex subunit RicT [Bacteroidales bacterium]|nr:regulatory iron-sulfur-containing complex subunit RicT [Bacteroidales bacterium]